MMARIFPEWTDRETKLWSNQPVRIRHSLHTSPLFTPEGLASLIESYPQDHYTLARMGEQGQGAKRVWDEGTIGDISGSEVMQAIAQGRMWLSLRHVSRVDQRYGEALRQIFEELRSHMPDFRTFDETAGILISSPKAQVYYHCDLPGQSLWQIMGRKRVYVYPNTEPFLSGRALEDISVAELEEKVAYEPWFDQHATVFDIGPGDMLHWPLNAPHRVENHDVLNVSMTMEYWTETIRRTFVVNMANGLLRHRFGVPVTDRSLKGAGFWAKAAFQKVARRDPWLKRLRQSVRPITFRLDRDGVRPAAPAEPMAA